MSKINYKLEWSDLAFLLREKIHTKTENWLNSKHKTGELNKTTQNYREEFGTFSFTNDEDEGDYESLNYLRIGWIDTNDCKSAFSVKLGIQISEYNKKRGRMYIADFGWWWRYHIDSMELQELPNEVIKVVNQVLTEFNKKQFGDTK